MAAAGPGGKSVKTASSTRRLRRSSTAVDAASLKRTLSTCEENIPTALPMLLDVVRGPECLPADEELQEMLRGKLRILQSDSIEVSSLFTELSTHLISINSEEKVIFVTFKTSEEIWKFTTYYTIGFLGQCLENLLFDHKYWLSFLEEDITIKVSVQEDKLNLIYKGILMQEGSFFAVCSTNQMFDSSTSGGDLYLEQGDIAQFEPPFLGSGWTVRCLANGARGTAPKPALEPINPFHQWFLKSGAESILVGDGKPACDFPLQFARGTCVATMAYDAEGPDELSVAPAERIIIEGLLVSCFDWFTGRKESTGEVGLVKTSLVKPSTDTCNSADIFLDGEKSTFFSLQEDKVTKKTITLLKKTSQNDTGHNYKLDVISYQDFEKKKSLSSSSKVDTKRSDLKRDIQMILDQRKDSDSVFTMNGTLDDSVLATEAKNPSLPCFTVHPVIEGNDNTENFIPLFSFLEGQDYKAEFGILYGLSSEILASSTFTGHSEEDELIAFLGVARETARKKRLFWSQTRLCFLLGKLCAGRSKFSQARVYFEEALSVPQEGLMDVRLVASIYSNLAAIYLLQKNTQSFFVLTERLVALLLGIPDCLESLEDNFALKYILKKAILSHNKMAEARACHLLAKHHWARAEGVQAVPYLERLLVLCAGAQGTWSISPSHGYLTLGKLYSELRLPHLSVTSARKASLQPSTLTDCLSSIVLALNSLSRLYGITEQGAAASPQMAPYLHQALSFTQVQGGACDQHHVLHYQLTVSLCQIFCKHSMVGQAICRMHTFINSNPLSQQLTICIPERKSVLIWLAWLHIDNNEPDVALDILDSVLASMPEHCTIPLEGVVLNMRGVALRCIGDLRRAAESYQAAVDICQEYEDMANWAVAQANQGLLCLKAGAKGLAESHLTEAVQLFSELDEGHEADFITVLLKLGQHYVKQHQLHYGKACYEWALLLAINSNLFDCQLTVTRHLCNLYGCDSPDQAQCIIYNKYLVKLLRCTGDREQEGDALKAISQLYLNLGTERAYRAALDYTKSSLGIFIDLGFREKEAYGWLQAGKIYHLLDQTELVDLYVQVAQDVAISTGDTKFLLKLLEAAGDIFFNNCQDRDKAITFYRDHALPIAEKSSCVHTRLRLCNKLTELMHNLKLYEEAVEFALTALDISITLGEHLNERVVYHRLASLYHCLDQYELAEHYYLKTLTVCPTPLLFDEETLYYVRVYQTLGDIMFYNLKDPFDAAGYYHLALAASMDLGNKRSQLQLCTRLATIYHNFLIDRELSLIFYQKARGFAAELNTSQTVKTIRKAPGETELAEVKIKLKKRTLQEMELDLEIKCRTLRKLDLEIQKLEREDPMRTAK
ncbi:SH3 domain and tetratricopeptide repeat-containing protein 1 isoform X2 [Acanthopagrus latus]|uniref:SH3 domain and tetratricopeptide repeat-containing protein 1 isoform X2 n=1 Tax=Acanthopagrus latus TaxID=8177 RepID=UPI00187BF465|nr:SH3 domain and tetratricopeptide repeat-containing protein 1 isoform X2 [Acanthopagrus latus]